MYLSLSLSLPPLWPLTPFSVLLLQGPPAPKLTQMPEMVPRASASSGPPQATRAGRYGTGKGGLQGGRKGIWPIGVGFLGLSLSICE